MSTYSLDLLTDPERRRAFVIRMARVRLPEHIIAFKLGLSLPALREEFAADMKNSQIDSDLAARETLRKFAHSGKNAAATIFWLQNYSQREQKPAPAKPPKKEKETYCTVVPPRLQVVGPDGTVYDSKF